MNQIVFIPLIVVSTIIQFSIQIYYIPKCLKDKRLSKKQKDFWLIILIFFNVLGAAFYVFSMSKKYISDYNIQEEELTENYNESIFLILVFAYEIVSFGTIIQIGDKILISILLAIIIMISVLRHYFINNKNLFLYLSIPFIQLIIVLLVEYISPSSDYKYLLLLVLANIINDYPLKYFKYFSTIPIAIYAITNYINYHYKSNIYIEDEIALIIMKNVVICLSVVGMLYILKKQLILITRLKYLMYDLNEKTKKLEEMSILKERNRIAREIHDTLGHTLTGAIIQLEAAKKLVQVDSIKAIEAIEKTQDTTRTGFSEVKRAIKALRPILVEENSLSDSIELLSERIKKDYGYDVKYNLNIPENINDDIKISIYRIIQELITNSIRHGKANSMELCIDNSADNLYIDIIDNGKGCNEIKEGYGLKGIRERIEVLEGNVKYESHIGEGFSTTISIPIKKS